ncbi:MAG: redoxin domain-containing protein [Chitinophagaceae bacterium]
MRKWVCLLVIAFIAGQVQSQEIRKIKATDLEKIIAESKTPLIINMWATWCKPCLAELPHFLEEVKKNNAAAGMGDSVNLLLVSLDFKEAFPSEIATVAKKRKLDAPIAWLDETNADYFCPKLDAKWSGAIPATLFINNKSGYRNFVEGEISHEQLKEIMAILLKR